MATDVGGTGEVAGRRARLVPYGDPDLIARPDRGGAARAQGGGRRCASAARARAAELPDDDALAQVLAVYRTVIE